MDLIIGGAFQGKLDYARNAFGLREEEIVTCTPDSEPDWNARCLCRVEEYVLYCVRRGVSPEEKFRPDAVLVGRDIFCGVVPIDPEERAFLLDGILSPFGASPAETSLEDGTFTAALRLPDRDCAIRAAGELCRRGYRPGPETSEGEILLARSPADLCRLVFGK